MNIDLEMNDFSAKMSEIEILDQRELDFNRSDGNISFTDINKWGRLISFVDYSTKEGVKITVGDKKIVCKQCTLKYNVQYISRGESWKVNEIKNIVLYCNGNSVYHKKNIK